MNYQATRASAIERTNPPKHHSRYVHLRLLLKTTKALAEKYVKPGKDIRFADLGCGELPYHSIFRPYVKEYYAIDLPGNPKATHEVDVETNRSNLDDESCDVVWSLGVLEHVGDTKKYLREAHRLLKPGGRLMLSTHGIWIYHPDPIDFWRFTSEGLRVTIEREGFRVIELVPVMGLLSTAIQLMQDAVLASFPFVKIWKVPFCYVSQRLIGVSELLVDSSKTLRAHRNKDACFYFFVAEKIGDA